MTGDQLIYVNKFFLFTFTEHQSQNRSTNIVGQYEHFPVVVITDKCQNLCPVNKECVLTSASTSISLVLPPAAHRSDDGL